ncbi:Polyketide synthase [Apiospora phragmitis]|uniref:Polyketide synthase n=1 Tax=Apiospora phragmitis TaxID=2905665 RepID=A0ABR1T319_9PEZI
MTSSRRVVGNLPIYSWDHSNTYWHESRLSKNYRFRPFPRHDLLGLFDVNSSPQDAGPAQEHQLPQREIHEGRGALRDNTLEALWEDFRVLSYDPQSESWSEHFTGMTSWDCDAEGARPEAAEIFDAEDGGLGHLTDSSAAEVLEQYQTQCDVALDATEVYHGLAKIGNTYGPSFQGLKAVHVTKCQSFAKVVIEDVV